jgi:hypothetical protein
MTLLEHMVYCYPSKYGLGLIREELKGILDTFGVDHDEFNEEFIGNTCALIDGNVIMYHHDILKVIRIIGYKKELNDAIKTL